VEKEYNDKIKKLWRWYINTGRRFRQKQDDG
jgi:hypothetical protein